MTASPLWAQRLYNQPLALDRFKNEVLCEFAQQRVFGVRPEKITSARLDSPMIAQADEADYYVDGIRKSFASKGNIAVVPVRGTLVQRGDWMDAESGLVGYNTILMQLRAASGDSKVSGIFMPFDSSGGEVSGLFAAAEELASLAKAEGGKPIYAYLDERACSAAYVLASGCDRILGRREVMGASIAALINVVDSSKMYEKVGLEAIVIRASWADRKARGQTGEKIDAELVSRLESIVEDASDQIAEFIAAMRGISVKSIKDLRGDVFQGPDLVKAGLLDEIASEQEAWSALVAETNAT